MKEFSTILVEQKGGRCYVTLNRPKSRNALNNTMVAELTELCDQLTLDNTIRSLILQGAGGWFCAGGDIKQFQKLFQGELSEEACSAENRAIGSLLQKLNHLPQTVIMLVEGAAIGGGFGLVCVSDIAIATADTRFALTETTLGIPPAQIAPFVVSRIGLHQARRLMLSAARFKGAEALALGLVDFQVADQAELMQKAEAILSMIERCGPQANALTKQILHSIGKQPLAETLDMAADQFAMAMLSPEGREGIAAFIEKRPANWGG